MTFYHGTTLDAAQSIKRQGLIPHRETAYQLEMDGDRLRDLPGEDKPYIYLQTDKRIAENYAQFRTAYERAKYGEKIDVSQSLNYAVKITSLRNPDAKPALVTIDVPATIARKLKTDPQNWNGGKVCLCVIPPRYIKSVEELPA